MDIERFKDHIKEHKTAYYCVVTGIVTAGITYLIMKGRYAENPMGSDRLDGVSVRPFAFLSKQNVVTVVEREGRGHPGYMVRCLESGIEEQSQVKMAKIMNISEKVLSKHLSGEYENAGGYHFERVAA